MPSVSTHMLCMEAIQTQIRALDLSGLDDANVVIVKLPLADRVKEQAIVAAYPAILISPFGQEQMDPLAGTNLRDDIGYPVVCSIVAADNQALQSNLDTYLDWRQSLREEFHNSRLAGAVSTVFNAYVEPGPVVLPSAWFANFWHSSLTIRCISRETRG